MNVSWPMSLFFIVAFLYYAVVNPIWAVFAYPTIGFLLWFAQNNLGVKKPFFRTIMMWMPDLFMTLRHYP